jgi:hypothetical protein
MYKGVNEFNKCRDQIHHVAKLTPVEITYDMLTKILDDFMMVPPRDSEHIIGINS